MHDLASPLIASIFISLLSFIGALTLFRKNIGSHKSLPYFISFAAGVMLSAALLDVLPEAIELSDPQKVLQAVLIGIVLGFFMERFVLWYHHHHEDTHHIKPSAFLVLFGDGIHNFIDGVAIVATYIANPAVGIATTIAIAAHEIPQELADFSILIHAGLSKKQALLYNFISALMAILGVFIGYYFLQRFTGITGLLLGFTAGIFLYIPLADLIPELHSDHRQQKNWKYALVFLFGILLLHFLILYLHE